jgi:hypothetical protein
MDIEEQPVRALGQIVEHRCSDRTTHQLISKNDNRLLTQNNEKMTRDCNEKKLSETLLSENTNFTLYCFGLFYESFHLYRLAAFV